MARIGLVLGAGGMVGQAYHAGVLAALEADLGWDPRHADLIVGSSAGSITGTLLRLGVPASDLAAVAVQAPLSPAGSAILDRLGEASDLPAMSLRSLLHGWRAPSLALLTRTARRPLAFRPSVAAMTLLPAGQVDIAAKAAMLDDLVGESWPEGLWICAARRRDGARTVFGRPGAPPASLAAAVAASCAIPGYFSPVTISGTEYFDGGVHSPTNLDVLRKEELDLVVVVSPMSAVKGRASGPGGLMRVSAHRRLADEMHKLRAAGTTVVRFEPGASSVHVMGLNAMDPQRADRVAKSAFVEAGRYASRPAIRERLTPLLTPDRQARAERWATEGA
ncbi:MAG: patatin-like phospholipase family protein [Actinomycetota bacterium]|nr:patatin-like phospholipase family protein [Actinomycetota bacterium]